MTRTLVLLLALTALVASPAAAAEETLYLQLLQPELPLDQEPLERSQILLAIAETASAEGIAGWCSRQRETLTSTELPRTLLRDSPYDRFATTTVALRLELLVEDVELQYLMGTERPFGTDGLHFPYFELCPVGFGSRAAEGWALDVLHLTNHRGQEIVLGVYKGVLPTAEREFLAAQLGHDLELPDPAGILLMGQGTDLQALLLTESPNGDRFEELRQAIVD